MLLEAVMNIGKLYETLTGERYPHAPETIVTASWPLAGHSAALEGLATAKTRADPCAASEVVVADRRAAGWQLTQ